MFAAAATTCRHWLRHFLVGLQNLRETRERSRRSLGRDRGFDHLHAAISTGSRAHPRLAARRIIAGSFSTELSAVENIWVRRPDSAKRSGGTSVSFPDSPTPALQAHPKRDEVFTAGRLIRSCPEHVPLPGNAEPAPHRTRHNVYRSPA
jgi:hypothetical protein